MNIGEAVRERILELRGERKITITRYKKSLENSMFSRLYLPTDINIDTVKKRCIFNKESLHYKVA